jgi:hypothetical protein
MAYETHEFRSINERCAELQEWLLKRAPHCLIEQKHLEEGGAERGYWAHGYLSARLDVMHLFMRGIPSHEDGSPSRYAT